MVFPEEDARNRLANQVPEEQRLSIADVVFTNNGSIEEFEAQISPMVGNMKLHHALRDIRICLGAPGTSTFYLS